MDIIAYVILIVFGLAFLACAAYYDHKKVPTVAGASIFEQIASALKDAKQLQEDLKPTNKE